MMKDIKMVHALWKVFCDGLHKSRVTTHIGNCVKMEVVMLAISCLAPTIICGFTALIEMDCNLLAIGIVIVYTVYLMNEKEKHIINRQNITHIAVWIRMGVLLIAFFGSMALLYVLEKMEYQNNSSVFGIYFQTLQYLSIYRLYITFFKALAVNIRQMKSERPPESGNSKK